LIAAQSPNTKHDLSKRVVEDVADDDFGELGKALKKDGRFSFPSYGTFSMRKRAARNDRMLMQIL
jgi:DNA-binding protein HU-beta